MKSVKSIENIIIRPASEEDYGQLKELCDRRLGDGYLGEEDYADRLNYPELNLVAEENGKIAGFVSMTPEDVKSLAAAVQLDEERIIGDSGGRPVIHFRTAIAEYDFDHSGVVGELLTRVVGNARELGYGLILSPTWKYNGKVPAGRVQESVGFLAIGERENLWVNQTGYTCVICKGPCRCEAVLYELKL